MSGTFRSLIDRLMGGRGDHSITVPVMDGPLKPNDDLERATCALQAPDIDNLTRCGDVLLASSGRELLEFSGRESVRVRQTASSVITALAASAAGAVAIGREDGGVQISGGPHDGRIFGGRDGGAMLNCPTALVFDGENSVLACNGSARFRASEWRRDLLERGQDGRVVRIDLNSGAEVVLAAGLAFPAGICAFTGGVAVAEAWRHRLIAIAPERANPSPQTLLDHLPAYPGRVSIAPAGGYWLAAFAVRSQLQEFVLRETRYRRAMMATIEPDYWIAPTLSSGRSFKEPLQAGGVIRLGVHKPWAPTRSYGLLIRLDADFQPIWSAHSRANGRRHGVTSVVDDGRRVLLTARGSGEILELPSAIAEDELEAEATPEAAA